MHKSNLYSKQGSLIWGDYMNKSKAGRIFKIEVMVIALTTLLTMQITPALALPQMVEPDRFDIELFADLTELGGFPRAFQMTLTQGENGFPKGLYLTSGPVRGTASDRLFHVDEKGQVSVVKDGFNSTQTMVFANGPYGDGMLITEPRELRIQRLLSDGSISTFAELGTAPFGPSVITYGSDGNLYVTDSASGNILLVKPDGNSEVFASIPLSGRAPIESASAIMFDTSGRYGGGFIAATFTGGPEPTNAGAIYLISVDGKNIEKLIDGLNGIELMTFGNEGVFGRDLYVASQETDVPGDGVVYKMTPDGKLTPFMKGIDATHVIFDTEGILGGGMFIAELPNVCTMCESGPQVAAGKIWRVVQSSVPSDTIKIDLENIIMPVKASLSNGSIDNADVDFDFTSLILFVSTDAMEDGTLEITLPRTLIDARTDGDDDEFIVLIDGNEETYDEIKATDSERTLRIPVPSGAGEIEIIGSQVIPEFGMFVGPVMIASLAIIIAVSRRAKQSSTRIVDNQHV